MNALGAAILLVLILVVSFSSPRGAVLGMLAGALFMTFEQVVNIAGFHLFALRFLEIAGFIRIVRLKELYTIKLLSIDKTLILLYLYATIVFLVRSKTDFAYTIGQMVDSLLCYFIFRALLTRLEDLQWLLKAFLVLLLPFVLLVATEMFTRNNPFEVIGGLHFVERGGRLRCMGTFRHPSLLGTLGASFLPLYIALVLNKNDIKSGFFGVVLCVAIILLANSGGPLSAAATGIVGWGLWLLREKMHWVRRGMVAFIILMAVVMKAPIWYLPAKVSAITGGDGWHRSYLMDVSFNNLDKWWLAGMPLIDTADWFPYTVPATGTADITNQFIAYGLQAGLLATFIFIALLVAAFKAIGQVLSNIKEKAFSEWEVMAWGLGCTLAVHISTWLGITYFDQTYLIWFMQLAAITSIKQVCDDKGIKSGIIRSDNKGSKKSYMTHRYRKNR
ncbi:hypothetical protein MCAMS1_01301 [biofilm metagenome]